MSSNICPGKYAILVNGNIGSVKNAIASGIRVADTFLLNEFKDTIESIDISVMLSPHKELINKLFKKNLLK